MRVVSEVALLTSARSMASAPEFASLICSASMPSEVAALTSGRGMWVSSPTKIFF